ncbi:glycosyltransferase family 2 protein [Candidatus Methylomirabilis sp.]|uniref:glycosyltransferase family 2 protein n=1 Tax=Candidatus Methylomirabilis sp. TaxID=2032687 RepID=UPI003C7599D0
MPNELCGFNPSPAPLTFIIPAYNEEAILAANIDRLRTFLKECGIGEYELIVVSNGSTDRTVEIARACAVGRADLTVIELPRRGVGMAFKEGVRHARYERLISLDLDLTIDLGFIESAAGLLGQVHLVIGSKQVGSQQRSWVRRLASATFIVCTRTLLGLRFTDYSIGAKAYRKGVIEPYLPYLADGSAYVLQLMAWRAWAGSPIAEVPVRCEDYRKSRFNLLHEGLYRFGSLVPLSFQRWGRKTTPVGYGCDGP